MRHHIVVAMEKSLPVKVECRSCHKQHRYKARPPGEKAPKSSETPNGTPVAPKAPRRSSKAATPAVPAAPTVNPLDALLASRSGAAAGNAPRKVHGGALFSCASARFAQARPERIINAGTAFADTSEADSARSAAAGFA